MPLAPMRPVMNERNQSPAVRSRTELTLSTAVLNRNRRFLLI